MKRLIALLILFPALVLAQSSPGLYQGQIPNATQWNGYFSAKQDYHSSLGTTIGAIRSDGAWNFSQASCADLVGGCIPLTGGGINNIPIGNVTPSTGAFTAGSYSGAITQQPSVATSGGWLVVNNAGGLHYFGAEDSASGTFGAVAYASIIQAPAGRVIQALIVGTGVVSTISATGISITGTITSSGIIKSQPSPGTSASYSQFVNTGGTLSIGMDDSIAGSFGTAGNYGTIIFRPVATQFDISRSGTSDFHISVAGAVTIPGTLTNTGLITANGGLTVANAQTLTLTGVSITGLGAASVAAGTFPAGSFSMPTLAVTSGLTLTGATITGAPTWGSTQTLNTSGSAGSATTATNFNNGTSSSSGGTVTATTFSGALSGNATSATTAGTVTTAAQTAITSVGTLSGLTVTAAPTFSAMTVGRVHFSGTAGLLSDASTLTFNSGTGALTATTFVGALTGNASGTAATVTGAAQAAITSVGTLTGLTMGGTLTVGANTLALASSTVSGTPTWSSNQAITLSTAAQSNVTSLGAYTPNVTSSEIAIPAAGATALVSHGLGVVPSHYEVVIRCKTAEFGYSIGDESTALVLASQSLWADATNVGLTLQTAGAISVIRRDTFASANITVGNWKLVFRAWK